MVVLRLSAATRSSLVSAIKSSTSQKHLPSGKSIHAHIIKLGFLPEAQIFNHLLNFYAKSLDFFSARKVFDEMPEKNLVSFSILISGYSQSDTPQFSLDLVPHLQKLGQSLNEFVFSSLILACSKLKRFYEGKQIHALVIVSDFETDPFVKTSLIDMYSKFDDLNSSISLFKSSPNRDPVLYNSMISGLVTFCSYEEAIELFVEARRAIDLRPTEFTFGSIIKACSNFRKEVGEQMHGFILKTGLESNCFVGTSLIDMYGKLGDMGSLIKIFHSTTSVDLALYNSMIAGCSNNNLHETALEFFRGLKLQGLSPDGSTFSSVLKACGGLSHIEWGRIIHGAVLKSLFQRDLVVNTALIDMYIKCGHHTKSCRLFESMPEKNAVVYNSMIWGYGHNRNFVKAISLFVDMNCKRIDPNHGTFVALMNSCSGHERSIYPHVIKRGFGRDLTVQNALLDSLIKDGAVAESQWLFSKMHEKDVVSWTTIISGLSQLGMHPDALELFKEMQFTGVCPNSFTLSSVLKACGSLVDLGQGRCVHGCSIKHGITDEFIKSALLDMYAKCGAFEESSRVFDVSCKVDVVSWNTMIAGYAQNGNGYGALSIFESMKEHEVEPNLVTFTSLLSACSRCGLVDEGVRIFESISFKHGIAPTIEHYACMVDLFGRAGMLDRAKLLIENMPFRPDISIWNTFLAACKLHGDVTLARVAKDHILDIGGQDTSSDILISNIYSEIGHWDDVERLRRRTKYEGGRKEPGLSWVQIKETDNS